MQGVANGFWPMIEAILDAGGQNIRDGLSQGGFKAFMNNVSAQRKRQTFIVTSPPGAQVFTELKPLMLVCQLALMNYQTHLGSAGANRSKNLIERHYDKI